MRGVLVNDIHSELNATNVARLLEPTGLESLVEIVRSASSSGAQLSLSGGRHAMGGQQFAADSWLIDMRRHAAIQSFDQKRGLVTVDAGLQWPELIAGCRTMQRADGPAWGIRQKQTGADRLTIGGALSANIHGRGLRMPPIVADVEAFTLVVAPGEVRRCSREENAELFRLAIGGYGLFGIIADVTLRLMPRVKVERRVEVITLQELIRVPEERDTREWLFGDFQFSIDERSEGFLRRGVFSAYHRIDDETSIPSGRHALREEDWRRLLHLAHSDRSRAFDEYAAYYLSTDRQQYWSDTHQLGTYAEDYHEAIDQRLGHADKHREMITEIYVPRQALDAFIGQAAESLRAASVPVVYGTIRLIERDSESFLAWAREPWACVIFNLCIKHTPAGISAAQATFRGLIDMAIAFRGSFYLTYHRWATRTQIEACHPRMHEFLRLKQARDPREIFTSDWYRHLKALFASSHDDNP